MNKLAGSAALIFSLYVSLIPNTLAASESNLFLSSKGEISPVSHFPGTAIWTIIDGQKGTILYQGTNGLAVIRLDVSQNNTCQNSLCFALKVTQVKNSEVAKEGDVSKISFDLENQKEYLSIGTGFLQGFDMIIDVSNRWVIPSGDFTVTLNKSGGIAGITKDITIYSQNHTLVQQAQTGSSTLSINDSDLKTAILQSKFFNLNQKSYPPISGSADYFAYSLEIKQGPFSNKVEWTDTSNGVPPKLVALEQQIEGFAVKRN